MKTPVANKTQTLSRLAVGLILAWVSQSAAFAQSGDDWLRGLGIDPANPAAAPAPGPGGAPGTTAPADGTTTTPPAEGEKSLFDTDGLVPPPGMSETRAPISQDAATLIAQTKQKEQFSRFWGTYAKSYISLESDYVCLPSYNPNFPSSLGMTLEQAREKYGQTVDVQTTLARVKRHVPISVPEAQAVAMTLPSVEMGAYGYVHSLKIDRVIGPDEMIVSDIWLLDAQAMQSDKDRLMAEAERKARIIGQANEAARNNANNRNNTSNFNNNNNNNFNNLPTASTLISAARAELDKAYVQRDKALARQRDGDYAGPFRVKGIPTEGLPVGERWLGPSIQLGKSGRGVQLGVTREVELVLENKNTSASASRMTLRPRKSKLIELVPASAFKTGLNQEEFVTMLASFNMTPDQFVDLVVAETKRNHEEARKRVFTVLEQTNQSLREARIAKAEADKIEAEKVAKEQAQEAEKKARDDAREAEKAARDKARAERDAEREARKNKNQK